MIEYVWLISSIEKMLTGGKKYDIKKNTSILFINYARCVFDCWVWRCQRYSRQFFQYIYK